MGRRDWSERESIVDDERSEDEDGSDTQDDSLIPRIARCSCVLALVLLGVFAVAIAVFSLMSGNGRHSGSSLATTTTPAVSTKGGLSLYCFALMLPFGHEPELIRAQLTHRVGIFDCDEFAVFSNV